MKSNCYPVVSFENLLSQKYSAIDCYESPDSYFEVEAGSVATPESLGINLGEKSFQFIMWATDKKFPSIHQKKKFEISKTVILHLSNAVVFPNTGQIIKDGCAIRENYAPIGYFDLFMRDLYGIFGYDQKNAVIDFHNPNSFAFPFRDFNHENILSIPEPTYMLSNEENDSRFYHWINLIMPKLKVFIEAMPSDVMYAVSNKTFDWQNSTLKTCFPKTNFKLGLFQQPIKFDSLFVVVNSNKSFMRIDYEYYKWLAKISSQVNTNNFPKKIYMSRSDVGRRTYANEGDISAFLDSRGISKVELSRFSFSVQLALVKNADLLVMPDGSSITYFPYVAEKCKVLYIAWGNSPFLEEIIESSKKLYNINDIYVLKNAFIEDDSTAVGQESTRLSVDIKRLESAIDCLVAPV
jgi:hypothetical protein